MNKNIKKKGFTLVELIAVVAILGILAIFLVPNIMGFIDKAQRNRLRDSSKTIIHMIDLYNAEIYPDDGILIDSANATETVDYVFSEILDRYYPHKVIDENSKTYILLKGLTLHELQMVSKDNFTYNGNIISIP